MTILSAWETLSLFLAIAVSFGIGAFLGFAFGEDRAEKRLEKHGP